jgi:chorismate mutase
MKNLIQLAARRSEIVGEIGEIKSMRKGTLNAKYQNVQHKGGEVVVKGPYYALTKKAPGGKTVYQSIPAENAPQIQNEVDNYKRFRQLSDEYVDVCEKISVLADSEDEVKKTKHRRGV